MSDPVDEAVRKLLFELVTAGFVKTSSDGFGTYPDREKLERVLTEQLAPLLRAGQRARLVCMNREVAQDYDAEWAKLTGRKS